MNKFVVVSKFFLSMVHYIKRNELTNLRMGTVMCCTVLFLFSCPHFILYFICSLAVEFSFQKTELMNRSYVKTDSKWWTEYTGTTGRILMYWFLFWDAS